MKREGPELVGGRIKKEKSNAKAVECMDMEGNIIKVYPSGIAISMALNIQQGDISLCCRGLKYSINGYRFRFHGDPGDPFERRKAAIKDSLGPKELKDTSVGATEGLSRTRRRASVLYSEIGEDGEPVVPPAEARESSTARTNPSLDHITHIKVRSWSKDAQVKLGKGSFFVPQWIPSAPTPNPVFKNYLPKKAKKKRYERKKNPLDM